MTEQRKVIVHIAASADGYIAGPDDDLDWLTSRPAPEGFYGMNAFMKTIDTMVIGRQTYEASLRMGASFDSTSRTIVFSRQAPPAEIPGGVRERGNRAICEPPSRAAWEAHLVDGRRRSYRLLSR